MNQWVCTWVWGVLVLTGFGFASAPLPILVRWPNAAPAFSSVLHYNVYTFNVSATGSDPVRELTVRAFRGTLLLTRFGLPVDGAVTGAAVADLDGNRLPELYVYTSGTGSGSLGRVYAWQFLPERRAEIKLTNWLKMPIGYMGHDSLWTERSVLCRKYPIYRPGDANALPSGGSATLRYRLQPSGADYALVPE